MAVEADAQKDVAMTTGPGKALLRTICLALAMLGQAPGTVWAQQSLSDALSFLLTNQSVPTGDFERDAAAAQVTRDTMSRLLLVELTTLPISASAAGFTYRFNPALGTLERTSDNFGPFFTERSLTTGRGRASVGLSLQVSRFTSLDGNDLRDGQFVVSGNHFRDEAQPFDVETLSLDVQSRTFTVFANVGVTDRLDLGVVLPFVSLSLAGERINTYHGQSLLQARADAEATGVGDVAVRAKYQLVGARGSGLALLGETRLPTGRDEDLLGAGEASHRAMVIGSAEPGSVAAHVNAGLTRGGLSDGFFYRGAVAVSASPRLTLVAEVLGRSVEEAGRMTQLRAAHPTLPGVETIRLVPDGTRTHTASAVSGVKWNVGGTLLLSGNVVYPLTERGLRSRPIPVVALDYSFGS
jgi:hypothetical protein